MILHLKPMFCELVEVLTFTGERWRAKSVQKMERIGPQGPKTSFESGCRPNFSKRKRFKGSADRRGAVLGSKNDMSRPMFDQHFDKILPPYNRGVLLTTDV